MKNFIANLRAADIYQKYYICKNMNVRMLRINEGGAQTDTVCGGWY